MYYLYSKVLTLVLLFISSSSFSQIFYIDINNDKLIDKIVIKSSGEENPQFLNIYLANKHEGYDLIYSNNILSEPISAGTSGLGYKVKKSLCGLIVTEVYGGASKNFTRYVLVSRNNKIALSTVRTFSADTYSGKFNSSTYNKENKFNDDCGNDVLYEGEIEEILNAAKKGAKYFWEFNLAPQDLIDHYRRNKKDEEYLNNIAYFVQKNGGNYEAILLLKEILRNNPNRIPAYLNIADAYMAIGKKDLAIKNYENYVELMKSKSLERKIPPRVLKLTGRN